MKKRIVSITAYAVLTTSLVCVSFAQVQQETPTASVQGNVPAQSQASQAMLPAVHALVLSMTENDLDFNPEDPQFLWTSLYYMLGLYGEYDQRAELTDESLILPTEVIQDYAAALYPDVSVLPEIPAPISERITYQSANDSYYLARGDAGLAEITVQSITTQSDGSEFMVGDLTYVVDGSALVSFEATLTPSDSMFGYILTDLTISD